ncbi:MAG: restriction endonuclease subunit S [Thermotogaceae bacterium]|nr:restriction endonuclease subunit S [Thermotogaceae bacterium]
MKEKEIPEGYKKTEIGKIPEDWEVKKLGDVFDILKTASYSRSELSKKGKFFYVHYGDIHTSFRHFIDIKNVELPTIEEYKAKNFPLLKNGDLIMVDASEDYEGIGKSVEIKNANFRKAIAGLHTLLLRDKNQNFVNGFKGFIVCSKSVKGQIEKLATGLKVYGISKQNLKKILLPIPSLEEQQAIANVLSDFDKLIESLDKLIAKKKNIKKGTMQLLLTGKKRLPGFIGEWVRRKLEEIGVIKTGGTPSTSIKKFWNGNIIWVTPTDINERKEIRQTERKISEEGLKIVGELPPNALLVTCIASIGKNAIIKERGACNQQINAIIPSENYDTDFLYYLMENNSKKLLARAGITATPIISKKKFSQLLFAFPPTLEEQKAIAQILSDMDAEIEALEKKKKKYKMMKKAAMELLLTGKIRLKEYIKGVSI